MLGNSESTKGNCWRLREGSEAPDFPPYRLRDKGGASKQNFLLSCVLCGERMSFRCRAQGTWRHDTHFLPVVRKLFSAIQAHDICAGDRRGLDATRGAFRRSRKTVVPV